MYQIFALLCALLQRHWGKCCVANSCLEALEEFPGTVLESRRAESEWARRASVIQEIPQLVQELHGYLNIIRLSMGLKYYRVKTYYLSTLKGTKKFSLSKPGIPATCKSTTSSFIVKPDPSQSWEMLADCCNLPLIILNLRKKKEKKKRSFKCFHRHGVEILHCL